MENLKNAEVKPDDYFLSRYEKKLEELKTQKQSGTQMEKPSSLCSQKIPCLMKQVCLGLSGYRAFTEASDGSLCLAMEYGGEKSLNDLIEERNKDSRDPFPAAIILKVALNVARGLKYLHQEKKLLHGDIKSSNVVIKGDFETIKICDVGVSLPLDENMTVTDPEACYIGTEPWKPKEALEENGIITDKADIFAFGLTLWEMMTLSIPHINLPDDDDDDDKTFDESDFDDEAYYAALGTRPPVNMEELDESYQKVIELFSVCTNEDPKDRPSAAHIVEALETDVQ
ncbi:Lymphokine-activated killer T-cell-originated protein kinase [Tupaia chinensis]|uniref:Lymphokine-activated killer T-cell-originated protein kinase n=1 Tax=Tupaia chinensis TaxID=246437 RepID=L9KN38_TUPCH|nr:Lymphokine-activated killer T-cell-originated protein kinase [Tupaia chinensis]